MTPVNGIGGAGTTGYTPAPRPTAPPAAPAKGGSFADELQRQGGPAGAPSKLQFSKHAAERVSQRGLAEDPQTVQRLENGVVRAAEKGSRAAVVLVDQTAYVVAVQNRTVITAVDQAHMKGQVFTNIDSAVIA
jgi:flagellar operon protein